LDVVAGGADCSVVSVGAGVDVGVGDVGGWGGSDDASEVWDDEVAGEISIPPNETRDLVELFIWLLCGVEEELVVAEEMLTRAEREEVMGNMVALVEKAELVPEGL
jgi:hypothetical protein